LNAITGIFLPTGIFFYILMIRFRIRLYRDLQHIIRVNKKLIPRVIELGDVQAEGSITVTDQNN
jgi:lipopolysaccharide export system permease protein